MENLKMPIQLKKLLNGFVGNTSTDWELIKKFSVKTGWFYRVRIENRLFDFYGNKVVTSKVSDNEKFDVFYRD